MNKTENSVKFYATIVSVIRYNKTKINTNLKAGLSENYYQTINGVKYRVHINSEGYVSSAYPNK